VQNLFETDANLVDWVTGEIHLTSPTLVPNTERVALEDGPMKTYLEQWISGDLGGKISDLSREKSAVARAEGRIIQAEEILAEGAPSTHEEWYDHLRRANRIIDGLDKDRKTKFARSIKKRIDAAFESLQQRANELAANPIAALKEPEPEPDLEEEEEPTKPTKASKSAPSRGPPPLILPPDVAENVRAFCHRLGSPAAEKMVRALVTVLLERELLTDSAAVKRFLQDVELRVSG
jgi:hypothetical protein